MPTANSHVCPGTRGPKIRLSLYQAEDFCSDGKSQIIKASNYNCHNAANPPDLPTSPQLSALTCALHQGQNNLWDMVKTFYSYTHACLHAHIIHTIHRLTIDCRPLHMSTLCAPWKLARSLVKICFSTCWLNSNALKLKQTAIKIMHAESG